MPVEVFSKHPILKSSLDLRADDFFGEREDESEAKQRNHLNAMIHSMFLIRWLGAYQNRVTTHLAESQAGLKLLS